MNLNHPVLVKPPQVLSNQVTLKNNFDIERRDLSETEIVLVQQGNVNAWFDGISYSLESGDIVLIPGTLKPSVFLRRKFVYADHTLFVLFSIRRVGGRPPALYFQ